MNLVWMLDDAWLAANPKLPVLCEYPVLELSGPIEVQRQVWHAAQTFDL